MKAYVEFYSSEGISPVSQDISDLGKHFRRRDALYRHLGIPPGFVNGKRVLEFGPGSGHNSIHTASLGPSEYMLVDANLAGIAAMKKLFDEYIEDQSGLKITESFIEEYRDEGGYDLVLCEGLLPTQERPVEMLRHVAGFAAPGGVVVITCIDAASYLAEQLRRHASALVTEPDQSTAEKLERLLPLLSPHLATIEGMSRPHDEWILDNILQPFTGGKLLGIDEAINAIRDTHNFYGVSPQFAVDPRWYKKVTGPVTDFSDRGIDQYWRNAHNFIDSRSEFTAGDPEKNRELLALAGLLYDDIIAFDTSRDKETAGRVEENLASFAESLEPVDPLGSRAISDCLAAIRALRAGSADPETVSWGEFAGCFGQAQQYVSFIRHA